LNQCRSYLSDLVKTGRIALIEEDSIRSLSINFKTKAFFTLAVTKTKIIGAEIDSRHKRSLNKANNNKNYMRKFNLTRKVFIQYIPTVNSSKAIKGKLNSKYQFKSI
jgi:hypothetical protein